MKLKDSDIEHRSIAGHTKEGAPVIYIRTHGGLHAIFKRAEDGGVESIAAAPHIAIAKWMAEKKTPGLKWEEDFHNPDKDLAKSESYTFEKMRKHFFSSDLEKSPLDNPNQFKIVYDYANKTFQVMTKSEMLENPSLIPDRCLIRDASMSGTVDTKKTFLEEGK